MSTSGPLVAAVDCGTHSTRMLVTDASGATVDRRMRITRLGQGVDASRRPTPEAVARTTEVLSEYRAVLAERGVTRVRAAATSAARDAVNRDAFLDAAESALGARPEILDGEEEARLSFVGAVAELDPADGPFLVADIGGGSTELACGREHPDGVASIDLGCVRVTERFLGSDPPAPDELTNALWAVRDELGLVVQRVPAFGEARRFVGLAGTVSAVAAIEMGLTAYDRDRIHHAELSRSAVEEVFRTLATESRAHRRHNPGLEAERVEVIVGGVVVLIAILRHFGFDACLVSEADILDGLAASLR